MALVGAVVLARPAEATHAADHRYVVLGYVQDTAGRPIADREVTVRRETTGLVYRTWTGSDGLFVLVVHVHDDDLLDRLLVRTTGAALPIEARFNPLEARVERGTRIDFTGDRGVERQEQFARTLEDYLKR
jgi:hypothetical protein